MLLKRPLIIPDRKLSEDETTVLGMINYSTLRTGDALVQAHSIVRHSAVENVESDEEMNAFLAADTQESQRYLARIDDLMQAQHYLRLAHFFAMQAIKG